MSITDATAAAGTESLRAHKHFNRLGDSLAADRAPEKVGEASNGTRHRMDRQLDAAAERDLFGATRGVAANLFAAFRNEIREALHSVGIHGKAAADLVRDVGRSLAEAVRTGSSFSFSMIAAATSDEMPSGSFTTRSALMARCVA